jgi:plasmid maintenance system antidote protein VapI
VRTIVAGYPGTWKAKADQLQTSRPHLHRVLHGKLSISMEMAHRLQSVFGINARDVLRAQLEEDIQKFEEEELAP